MANQITENESWDEVLNPYVLCTCTLYMYVSTCMYIAATVHVADTVTCTMLHVHVQVYMYSVHTCIQLYIYYCTCRCYIHHLVFERFRMGWILHISFLPLFPFLFLLLFIPWFTMCSISN